VGGDEWNRTAAAGGRKEKNQAIKSSVSSRARSNKA